MPKISYRKLLSKKKHQQKRHLQNAKIQKMRTKELKSLLDRHESRYRSKRKMSTAQRAKYQSAKKKYSRRHVRLGSVQSRRKKASQTHKQFTKKFPHLKHGAPIQYKKSSRKNLHSSSSTFT